MTKRYRERCSMQHEIPVFFCALGMREPPQCEKISISPRKRSAWKKFIFE
jgi:hypothetical protein